LYGDNIIHSTFGGVFMRPCSCHSGKQYTECCEPFISGKSLPKTPEQLMRSRYSAYAAINIDYIARTMRGPAAKDFNKWEAENWARQIEWLGLEIIDTGIQDNDGFVEFIAKYAENGTPGQRHEHSEFHRKDGKWYYVNGKNPSGSTPIYSEHKAGRNDPCPCKSGKKFKKCCGAT
jgi:SEC-C motif domain protein